MTLHVISCKKCNADYLVGIDGKDITQKKGSGDKNYFAIGNDELVNAPKVKKKAPCPECGTMIEVETSKGKEIKT